MMLSRGTLQALDCAGLDWREGDEPYSAVFEDGYSARGDTLAESRHVFLAGNELEKRFSAAAGRRFCVAELGFGTGCNFLLTRELFLRVAPGAANLHFWSVELNPLPRADLQRSLGRWPQLGGGATRLLQCYPPPLPGTHRRVFDDGRVVLDLVFADAADALQDFASFGRPCVDAWYLDGFAPSRNPAMWSPQLYAAMAQLSRPGCTLATYSTAGAVRRGLEGAGFALARRPGFGRKREALAGSLRQHPAPAPPTLTPWDLSDTGQRRSSRQPVAIIGAGLAGAHAAAALARRGVASTVVDAGGRAGRGSGNLQGVLFTRVSHSRSTLADFSLLSFLFATDLYTTLLDSGRLKTGIDGEISGCLQLLSAEPNDALRAALAGLPGLASLLDRRTGEMRLGEPLAGLWLPQSGWLSPPAVCAALLDNPLIELREHCAELQLRRTASGTWCAENAAGNTLVETDRVIVAAGSGCRGLLPDAALPLRSIRGQTTQIPAPPDRTLQAALCHRGYIAPARAAEHCIGATFQPGDEDLDLRIEDHEENIEALARALPDWRPYLASLDPRELDGRAELRCASPDYLPLIGPVPDVESSRDRLQDLARNARRVLPHRGAYQPGLYLSTAHGSRGLSYAALGAELLASQLCGEPSPLSRELTRALSPARFLVREISRSDGQRGDAA